MKSQSPHKVSCHCPNGHKIRGPISMTGEKVACPSCETEFVFGVQETASKAVTDTGVMRILGDSPIAAGLGDSPTRETCPCSACGIAIDASSTVCKHCNTYVGMLPLYMRTMREAERA